MTKICSTCGIEKPVSEFNKDKRNKDGLRYSCRECEKIYRNNYFKSNREKINSVRRERYNSDPEFRSKAKSANMNAYRKNHEKRLEHNSEYRKELQEFVESLRQPCVKCGESKPWLIQFHHINYKDKKFQIQADHSRSQLLEEAKKCVCLCTNCHTEYHYFYGKQPSQPEDSLKYYLSEEFTHEKLLYK